MCLTFNVQSSGGLSSLNRRKRDEIHDRKRQYCILVETSITRIPERLEEIDSNLFVCLNTRTQNFEVHSLANRESTYCFSVPYNELDSRVIEVFQRSNLKTRNAKEIIWQMDRENEELERRRENHRRSETNAWAREYRSMFKKAAEEVY